MHDVGGFIDVSVLAVPGWGTSRRRGLVVASVASPVEPQPVVTRDVVELVPLAVEVPATVARVGEDTLLTTPDVRYNECRRVSDGDDDDN